MRLILTRMKYGLFVICAVLGAAQGCAAERSVLSMAPNRRIVIVEERAESGDKDYYFASWPDKKKLGSVLSPEERGELSNVAIVASWNAKSTKVALLLFYGTRLSELLLFSQAGNGKFQPVELAAPDAIEFYEKQTRKTSPQPSGGGSENGVGPWLDKDTVALFSGEATQLRDADGFRHILVTFRARITGGPAAELSHLKLVGPLNDAQDERWRKKWGRQYSETHE